MRTSSISTMRDVDVPLSELGHAQADRDRPLVRRLARGPAPRSAAELVPTSAPARPPRRSAPRAALAGGAKPTVLDERLREREFGVFDGLTPLGIAAQYPEEAAHRAKLGKFYHRAPGGESWADVILRLRSALNTINLQYAGKRVLVVGHQVVVMCLRYILDELTEEELMALNKQGEMLNCGISAFDFDTQDRRFGKPTLALWNHAAPLDQAQQTSAPDKMAGSR